jgi:vancomycin resistance protein VanW
MKFSLESIPRPAQRSALRRRAGRVFYQCKRWLQWQLRRRHFARQRSEPLQVLVFQHHTPLLRQLRALDMDLQHNKVTNLRLAAAHLDGLLIRPGETFSFWRSVGRPSARKGYLEGLVLEQGQLRRGTGGGLCQLGNLLYWMALHSPLTVVERWRHSYDVFPDAGRTQPFGSGATLAYNYIDLQLRNDSDQDFQISVWLSADHLHGALRSTHPAARRYEVYEAEHLIRQEPWGGHARHNRIARRVWDAASGTALPDEWVADNHALMMYQPFLSGA